MWDLTVYLIQPQWHAGSGGTLPGFWSGRAPRQAPAPRRRDALWVYVRLEGDASITPRAVEQLVHQAQQVYWSTHGSVTGAMLQAAQSLHQRLQRVNRRLEPRGYRLEAHLAMAVWRNDDLFLAWSGPWSALVVDATASTKHYPPDPEAHGLGREAMPDLRLAQVTFDLPVFTLFLMPEAPALAQEGFSLQQEPERLLQAWAQRATQAHWGVAALWEPGSHRIERRYILLEALPYGQEPAAAEPMAPGVPAEPEPQPEDAEEALEPEGADRAPEPAPRASREPVPPAAAPARPAPTRTRARPQEPPRSRRGRARGRGRGPMARLGRALLRGLAALLYWELPTRPVAWLSVLLPLLVAGLTLGQYLQEGRALRHRQWLALAYQQMQQAMRLPDPYQRGPAMQRALETLDQAERFGRSAESAALRREALQWLDRWEGIERLDFQAAMAADLPEDVDVTRLAPGTRGLYALDRTRDRVWYLGLAANVHAFAPEPEFQCAGSRTYGGLQVGRLVDLITVPGQPFPFEAAAFDAQGQWLSCRQEDPPQAHLLPMPTTRWGEIFRVRAFQEDLYLLDRKSNNLFVVRLSRPQAAVPRALFPLDQGPDLTQVVDFALLRGEAFFLMVDGQVLHCTFPIQEEGDTQCTFLEYQDQRLEREGRLPVLPNTRFTAIEVYPGPEPGLLLLDTQAPAIYHFTLKLRFVAQYRPRQPWPAAPQAFTTTALFQQRPYLYVMVGPEIFTAPLP